MGNKELAMINIPYLEYTTIRVYLKTGNMTNGEGFSA